MRSDSARRSVEPAEAVEPLVDLLAEDMLHVRATALDQAHRLEETALDAVVLGPFGEIEERGTGMLEQLGEL